MKTVSGKIAIFIVPAITGLFITFTLNAQIWKVPIYATSGAPQTKSLKLKPGWEINIGTLIHDNDSLTKRMYYYGSFIGAANDSLQIKLNMEF